jgi:Arc/MetJ-type ribon-helix-helix transcriptional regulator
MGRKKYRIIGLPEELFLDCGKIVKSGKYGYTSVSELVKDAVRRRLESLGSYRRVEAAPEKQVEA